MTSASNSFRFTAFCWPPLPSEMMGHDLQAIHPDGGHAYTIRLEMKGNSLEVIVYGNIPADVASARNFAEQALSTWLDSLALSELKEFHDLVFIEEITGPKPQSMHRTELGMLDRPAPATQDQVNAMLAKSAATSRAVLDLHLAIARPFDTVFYCFRAMEAMMNEYIPEGASIDDSKARKRAWAAMWLDLGIGDLSSKFKKAATRMRHGSFKATNWPVRKAALEAAVQTFDAFVRRQSAL